VIDINIDIVGGSFAGLSTAISIKEINKSINVTIHEKHKKIGYNREGRKCGEAHSIEEEWNKWIPDKKSIFNELKIGEITVGDKKTVIQRDPGTAFILNRQEFICQLARNAEKLGVNIQTNDKIKAVNELDGNFIIDASGCPSSIKRELGFNKGIKGVTYQQTLEDSNYFISNTAKVIYLGSFGYIWIFPRNPEKKEINLGIGFSNNFGYNLKEMLEKFKEENGIKGEINYTLGGLIPLGLQRPLMYKNILFVGDAGVGSFIFSGQGIYRALISGDIAGKCIAKRYPKKYPYIIQKKFIKWDVIGKIFTNVNFVFRKINPKLVLTSYDYVSRFGGMIH